MTPVRPARFVARTAENSVGRVGPAGICPEAIALLAGYQLPDRTVAALRRMITLRQLAAAMVMLRADNCSGDLARALLAATPASQRADDPRGRQADRHRAKLLSGMEKGLTSMQDKVRSMTPSYHEDLYCLALTASFVRSWMRDDVVAAWLQSHAPGAATALVHLVSASETAAVPKRRMKLPYAPAVQAAYCKRR